MRRCVRLVPAMLFTLPGLLAPLAGCASTDPLEREGLWRPMGANDMNLAAEVANPADLVRGQQTADGSDGQLAVAAVHRLRHDQVKPLPASAITDLHVQGSPSGGGGAADSGAAAP